MTAGGDSLVAHPRGCRPRGGSYAGVPGRRCSDSNLRAAERVAQSLRRRTCVAWDRVTHSKRRRTGTAQDRVTLARLARQSVGVLKRPPTGAIPDAPGSYQFLDEDGRVLYVGKAKSLRSRLSSYFADPATLPARTAQMLASAASVQWIQVATEVDAVMLECSLIKQHRPRYNVRLVDDKSYPWVALSVSDAWPRVAVVRGRRRPGVRYFGPYAQAWAIRDTVDLLVRCFKVRTCSDTKLERHRRLGSPCLLAHIDRCSAPCVGWVEPEEYARYVADLSSFLSGDIEDVVERIEAEMRDAARSLDFEHAARLRDQLASVHKAMERQQVVSSRREDVDVVGIAEDELVGTVSVLHVRRGRVVGRRSIVVEKIEDLDAAGLVERAIEEMYANVPSRAKSTPPDRIARPHGARSGPGHPSVRTANTRPVDEDWSSGAGDPLRTRGAVLDSFGVPRRLVLPVLPDEAELYRELLALKRAGPVELLIPRRGARRELLDVAMTNAAEELSRQRLRRVADHDSRTRALHALEQHLGLPEAPLRIECYDMSHLQGSDYVGSMVVLEDGLARPSEYRRFKIRTVPRNDDYAAMEEVLTRRLTSLLEERAKRASGEARRRSFAYPPQLILLDGGKGQLAVGMRVLDRLGLSAEISLAALAKSFEEVFVPGRPDPVSIPRGSEALYLLQQVRDEAHRFAIAYHRSLRSRRVRKSALEAVPGLGPRRRSRLVKELGGVGKLKQASIEDLLAIPWLPERVARSTYEALHPGTGPPGMARNGPSSRLEQAPHASRAAD